MEQEKSSQPVPQCLAPNFVAVKMPRPHFICLPMANGVLGGAVFGLEHKTTAVGSRPVLEAPKGGSSDWPGKKYGQEGNGVGNARRQQSWPFCFRLVVQNQWFSRGLRFGKSFHAEWVRTQTFVILRQFLRFSSMNCQFYIFAFSQRYFHTAKKRIFFWVDSVSNTKVYFS